MKKCMIIGGAGFIGMNLASCLENSYDVSILDRVEPGEVITSRFSYYKADFFKEGIDEKLVEESDIIILLACTVGPKTSMQNPRECYDTNIMSLIPLLESMKKYKSKQLFFVSSGGTIYGEHGEEVLNEEIETYPINHYGIMKLAQEKIILMYNKLYGMKNVIFRLANPYGCGQQVSSGVGAVTAVLNNVMNDEEVHIWGDGNNIRDYIYIEDAVNMMKLFMDQNKVDDEYAVYNIATGVGTSINDIVDIVENITSKKANVVYEESRLEDVKRNVLDTTKIQKIIGKYNCISVRKGIENYYDFCMGK